jgi:tryptophan synthase alpha chain
VRVATSPLAGVFERCREDDRAALIAFLTAGFPSLEQTPTLVAAAIEGGADIIELGFPYSDPVADGPIIQASSQHALEHGATFDAVLEAAARCSGAPLIAFTYYNLLFSRGLERSARDLKAAGFSGAIVPDLPPEEGQPLSDAFKHAELALTFLVAPTTPLERSRMVAARCDDFVYVAGRLGVTGMHAGVERAVLRRMAALRGITKKPLVIGFGISRPDQARVVANYADGIVIGSALVEASEQADAAGAAKLLCFQMRKALELGRRVRPS